MFRTTFISLIILLVGCASTPKQDLSKVKLYLYPSQYIVEQETFEFSQLHRDKAKQAMKQQGLDLLLEVYLSKKGEVLDIDLVKKHSSVDNQTVASIKSQLKRKDFFHNFGVKTAFFYGVRFRTEVEYM